MMSFVFQFPYSDSGNKQVSLKASFIISFINTPHYNWLHSGQTLFSNLN